MRIRSLLLALLIGAALSAPGWTPPAQAKTHHYKPRKVKQIKRGKFKAHKVKYKARKVHHR